MAGTILLVDTHPVAAWGLSKALQEAGVQNKIELAYNIHQALQALADPLALLIIDPSMPDTTPDMFVTVARRKHPELPILFFSGQAHGIYLSLAHTLGISGYLEKTTDLLTLIAAIRMALSGMQCFPRQGSYVDPGANSLMRLSARELVVLQLLRQGLRNKDIAERLFLSPKTVSSHRTSLMRKLRTNDIVSAALDNVITEGKVLNVIDITPSENNK